MSYQFEAGKDSIIQAVINKIQSEMNSAQGKVCEEFVKQFYATVAPDDLLGLEVDDLYGAAINFWSLIEKRAPNETKIRIYNPDFERHGWQTTHTVVEVISDDMPFLVDSMRIVINRMDLVSHLIIHMGNMHVIRDKADNILNILPRNVPPPKDIKREDSLPKHPFLMEIDRQTNPATLEELHRHFERVLEDNRVVVADWLNMRTKVHEIINELEQLRDNLDINEVEETKAFLNWIEDHHFTFLGVRDYQLVSEAGDTILKAIPGTGLGVLRENIGKTTARNVSLMTPEARELTLSSRILVMSKTNTLASVHRDAYTDYIGVKRFNEKGEVIGERRIIGLYTSAAYNTNPKHIPFCVIKWRKL